MVPGVGAKVCTEGVVAAVGEAAIGVHKWRPGAGIPSNTGQIGLNDNSDTVKCG